MMVSALGSAEKGCRVIAFWRRRLGVLLGLVVLSELGVLVRLVVYS